MSRESPLPVRQGVGATRLRVPATGWASISAYMVERFSHLEPERLLSRFDQDEIVSSAGEPISRHTPLGQHDFVWYYRDPPQEREIPFAVDVLHQDEHLVVADKPHFLPTTPGGKFLQNSALVRLRNQLGIPELTPIHRLDRATAGLVMFSVRPQTRGAYQLLFERRQIEKTYEAVSGRPLGFDGRSLAGNPFPIRFRNHIEKHRGNVCVQVRDDLAPNSETRVELLAADNRVIHTRLHPHSGRMHQLRVHLAALGAGILHDSFYPTLLPEAPDDFSNPMQLLATELRFIDPLSGDSRVFRTRRRLQEAPRMWKDSDRRASAEGF